MTNLTTNQIIRKYGFKFLGYLAGCLDCDGYFTIKKSTYHMRVRGDATQPVFSERIGLKQVKPEIVDLLTGCFSGYRAIQKSSAKRGQSLYAWQVTDRQAYVCAKVLLPYLRIKKEQAKLLIELRASKERGKHKKLGMKVDSKEIELREELFNKIKALNDTRNTKPRLI